MVRRSGRNICSRGEEWSTSLFWETSIRTKLRLPFLQWAWGEKGVWDMRKERGGSKLMFVRSI